jgi:hypothetical protein
MNTHCDYCGQPITALRSTRKYCNDTCKQMAYYQRNGLLQGLAPDRAAGNTSTHEQSDDEKDRTTTTHKQPLIVKSLYSKDPDDFTVKQPKEPGTAQYEWVESSFLLRIHKYIVNSNVFSMFQNPHDHWTQEALPYVQWVTVRFRCLVESLVRLSNHASVDRDTLLQVADAFNQLSTSANFEVIQHFYPFTDAIHELKQKLNALADACEGDRTAFKLSPRRKAQLIGMRFEIGDFVPRMKFSELGG